MVDRHSLLIRHLPSTLVHRVENSWLGHAVEARRRAERVGAHVGEHHPVADEQLRQSRALADAVQAVAGRPPDAAHVLLLAGVLLKPPAKNSDATTGFPHHVCVYTALLYSIGVKFRNFATYSKIKDYICYVVTGFQSMYTYARVLLDDHT